MRDKTIREKLRDDFNQKPKNTGVVDYPSIPELSKEDKERLLKIINDVHEKHIAKDTLDIKQAYPNYDQYISVQKPHDIQKWMTAVKDIVTDERSGYTKEIAVKKATSGWNVNEVRDFLNWLRFYEEGAHLKYKTAQANWYQGSDPGYFFSMQPEVKEKEQPAVDFNLAQDQAEKEMQRKELATMQKKKIVGRLDSLEKLIRSSEGELLAGEEYDNILEIIYSLKKKINTLNKKSKATKMYADLIVRESNILGSKGFFKAANLLYSVAEEPTIEPASPAAPTQLSGAPGGALNAPGAPTTPPDAQTSNQPVSSVEEEGAVEKFVKNMNPDLDNLDSNDVEDLSVEDSDDLLVTEAQLADQDPIMPIQEPVTAPETTIPAAPISPENKETPLEVTEPQEDIEVADEEPSTVKDFDGIIDSALANVTIKDIADKLEELVKVFKVREIPRQLAFIDMLLDKLGMSSFFPGLSEAQAKSLESNNYIQSRVEEVLSRLQGALKTHDLDLTKSNELPASPEVESIKNKLKSDEDKEKSRKEMRKEVENKKLEDQTKETPEIEVEEDLGAPEVEPITEQAPPIAPAAPIPIAPKVV